MNITAILTKRCNLRCSYCFEGECSSAVMDEATAMRACEFASEQGGHNGISFFGGEPLLQRGLIEKMVRRCAELGEFTYSITTNGTLLDESFVEFARENRIRIALSHDGVAQDVCRRYPDGRGTADRLYEALRMACTLPDTVIMLTVTQQTVGLLSDSVSWLWGRGARRILVAPDGRPGRWADDGMSELERQYFKIADEYEKRMLRGENVRFLPFDTKISDRVKGKVSCNNCRLGYRQPIIDTDGAIYPCVQFTSRPEYRIGDVFSGFDEEKRQEIFIHSLRPVETCTDCPAADRCSHACPCANFEQTGNMNTVSAFTCTHQRMLIDAADSFAERLYSADSALFLRRYSETYTENQLEA